jgi:hypothetical protein
VLISSDSVLYLTPKSPLHTRRGGRGVRVIFDFPRRLMYAGDCESTPNKSKRY